MQLYSDAVHPISGSFVLSQTTFAKKKVKSCSTSNENLLDESVFKEFRFFFFSTLLL